MNKVLVYLAILIFILNDVISPLLGGDPYAYGNGLAGILLGIAVLNHFREAESTK